MSLPLRIVEPTLNDQTGHCFSYLASLFEANHVAQLDIELWAGSRAAGLFPEDPRIEIRPFFRRRIRRLQAFFLYRSLLRTPGAVFVPTAGRTDLMLLNWASPGPIPREKVYLFFHWFRPTSGKLQYLRKTAQRHPEVVILGPTPSIVKVFKDAGFPCCEVVPYPISTAETELESASFPFQRVLSAGAARQDKGFSLVVDLIEYLASRKASLPISVQVSTPYSGRHDEKTLADIKRLNRIAYPPLEKQTETLDDKQYHEMFRGSICLQLYDRKDFEDRVSAVTLDALSAGAPIVTTAGTWIARMVERFEAGIVLDDLSPNRVYSALETVVSRYSSYQHCARQAGQTLRRENSSNHLLEIVSRGLVNCP